MTNVLFAANDPLDNVHGAFTGRHSIKPLVVVAEKAAVVPSNSGNDVYLSANCEQSSLGRMSRGLTVRT